MCTFGLGYNSVDRYEDPAWWGLSNEQPGRQRRIWLPWGIVIPWWIAGDLWRINIRRPLSQKQLADGNTPKYIGPAGWNNSLFNADRLVGGKPAMLVEGEFDAMIIQQEVKESLVAAATGSTHGSRYARWLAELILASKVLLAFDTDPNGAGEKAAEWWQDILSNATRWRPLWDDVSSMVSDRSVLRSWISAGLKQ